MLTTADVDVLMRRAKSVARTLVLKYGDDAETVVYMTLHDHALSTMLEYIRDYRNYREHGYRLVKGGE